MMSIGDAACTNAFLARCGVGGHGSFVRQLTVRTLLTWRFSLRPAPRCFFCMAVMSVLGGPRNFQQLCTTPSVAFAEETSKCRKSKRTRRAKRKLMGGVNLQVVGFGLYSLFLSSSFLAPSHGDTQGSFHVNNALVCAQDVGEPGLEPGR